jgi:peroxiredoxin
MAQLRRDYEQFKDRDTEVIAVGPEDKETFTDFWVTKKMPFPGIPDPQHKLANLYGQKVKILKMGRMPALILIDKLGKIRYRHYGESMSDIPENKEVLGLLDDINREAIADTEAAVPDKP